MYIWCEYYVCVVVFLFLLFNTDHQISEEKSFPYNFTGHFLGKISIIYLQYFIYSSIKFHHIELKTAMHKSLIISLA